MNKDGAVTIRARSIGVLYRRLKPHLNGSSSRSEVVARVPERLRVSVDLFLWKLEEAGAIVCRKPDSERSEPAHQESDISALLGSQRPRGIVTVGSQPTFVSLQGPVRENHTCARSIFLVTPYQMGRELFLAGRPSQNVIYVVAETSGGSSDRPTVLELNNRCAYARWLMILMDHAPAARGRFSVYKLSSAEGTLTKVLQWASNSAEKRALPRRLGLITMVDENQRPLACLRAYHEFFSTDIARFGVRSEPLYEELIIEFLGRVLLLTKRTLKVTRLKWTNAGLRTLEKERIGSKRIVDHQWAVAGSLLHARAGALEIYMRERGGKVQSIEVMDVLRVISRHPEVVYLQKMLRLRFDSLEGRCETISCGAVRYEAAGRQIYSLLREKALRDLLLVLTWDTFYGSRSGLAPQLGFDFDSFVDGKVLRNLVETNAATLGETDGLSLLSHRVHIWGRKLCLARVDVL